MRDQLSSLPSKVGRLGGGLWYHVRFGGSLAYTTTEGRYRSTGTAVYLVITSYISTVKRSQGGVPLTDLNDRVWKARGIRNPYRSGFTEWISAILRTRTERY